MSKIKKFIVVMMMVVATSCLGACSEETEQDGNKSQVLSQEDTQRVIQEQQEGTKEEIQEVAKEEVKEESKEESEEEFQTLEENNIIVPVDGAVQTSNEEKAVEQSPIEYTYTEMELIKYAKSSVNVRDMPTTDGNKVGALAKNDEVYITGQCNETSWFRIAFNGTVAYVNDSYLIEQKIVEVGTEDGQSISKGNNEASEEKDPISVNGSHTEEPVVTIPTESEAGENLVWVPTNGGTKYHSKSSCSKMKDPIQVTLETAVANGFTPCKRCHK